MLGQEVVITVIINVVRSVIRSCAPLRLSHLAGAIIMLILSCAVSSNVVFAPVFAKSQSSAPIAQQPKAHNVKITSPTKGQTVPVGKDLFVSGTSVGNSNSTSINCQVSVIVNGIKPYQPTSPSGPNGSGDYSKWNFILTPKYTTIKEGQNKITAKYACANNSAALSHNSVNVTGVIGTSVKSTTVKIIR